MAGAIDDLYPFGNPTLFRRVGKKNIKKCKRVGYMEKIRVPGTDISLELGHEDKERTRITVPWLSMTYPLEAAKAIVEATTGDANAEAFRLRNQDGRCGKMCRPTRFISHYVPVEVPDRKDEWNFIKFIVSRNARSEATQGTGQISVQTDKMQGGKPTRLRLKTFHL